MEIPSLPSDNLYKFIAISGLVLTLGSLTYPVSKVQELELAAIEVKAERAKLEIEMAEIERLIGNLEKEKNPTPQDVITLRERTQQSKIKAVDLQRLVALAEAKLSWAQRYLVAAFIGFLVGPWLTLFGFTFWYLRGQKPLDEQLGNRA